MLTDAIINDGIKQIPKCTFSNALTGSVLLCSNFHTVRKRLETGRDGTVKKLPNVSVQRENSTVIVTVRVSSWLGSLFRYFTSSEFHRGLFFRRANPFNSEYRRRRREKIK